MFITRTGYTTAGSLPEAFYEDIDYTESKDNDGTSAFEIELNNTTIKKLKELKIINEADAEDLLAVKASYLVVYRVYLM